MDDRKRKTEPGRDSVPEVRSTEHEVLEADAPEQAHDPAEAQEEPEIVEPAEVAEAEPSEADRLREEIAQLQSRLRTVSKAYTDLQAEMRAFRERAQIRLEADRERKSFEVVQAFFEPVMNLKRSLASHGDDVGSFVEGLRMIYHQFHTALENLGLEKIPGEGADFDPTIHEALAVTPVADPSLDGKVLTVHSDGYMVKGKPLQVAQVVIGKYEAPQGEA